MSMLSSPYTVQIFDFGSTSDGTLYYVMELLEGIDLEALVRRHGPLPQGRVVYLLQQICASLAEAHENGLVHRDVKPANVYVCKLGTLFDCVKVLDFGLVSSRANLRGDEARLTDQNKIAGTPAYLAPETITDAHTIDERVDIYALGCMAYFMLTAKVVFDSTSHVKVLLAHVDDAPVPPSARTDMPITAELERLVLQCLAKDPKDRPSSARAVGRRLAVVGAPEWQPHEAADWWADHPLDVDSVAPSVHNKANESVMPL